MKPLIETEEVYSKRDIESWIPLLRSILDVKSIPHTEFDTDVDYIKIEGILFQHWIRPDRTSLDEALSNYPRPHIPLEVKNKYLKKDWIKQTLEFYKKWNVHFIVIIPRGPKFWVGKYWDIPEQCWRMNPDNEKAKRLLLDKELRNVPYDIVKKNQLKDKINNIIK